MLSRPTGGLHYLQSASQKQSVPPNPGLLQSGTGMDLTGDATPQKSEMCKLKKSKQYIPMGRHRA